MRTSLAILVFSVLAFAVSCDNKKGMLPPKSEPLPPGACDSITYSNGIKAIFDANCATSFCHDGTTKQSNLDFSLYSTAQSQATNGRIKARVIDANPSPMPPSGKLPQSQLDSIQCWLDKGAPF